MGFLSGYFLFAETPNKDRVGGKLFNFWTICPEVGLDWSFWIKMFYESGIALKLLKNTFFKVIQQTFYLG